MTREEAIKIIEYLPVPLTKQYSFFQIQQAYKMAIKALKREPCVIRCEKNLAKEDFEAIAKRIHEENQNVVVIPYETEVVSTNTSTNISTKPTNISTNTSTNTSIEALQYRPSGKWIIKYDAHSDIPIREYYCDQCGKRGGLGTMLFDDKPLPNFCGNCGADMRGSNNETHKEETR